MSDAELTYCRLCAVLKSSDKMIDLERDEEKRHSIHTKLHRLDSNLLHLFHRKVLPKTVCLTCMNSLDRAYDFIIEIESAQKILDQLILGKVLTYTDPHVNEYSDNEITVSTEPRYKLNETVESNEECGSKDDIVDVCDDFMKCDVNYAQFSRIKKDGDKLDFEANSSDFQISKCEVHHSGNMGYMQVDGTSVRSHEEQCGSIYTNLPNLQKVINKTDKTEIREHKVTKLNLKNKQHRCKYMVNKNVKTATNQKSESITTLNNCSKESKFDNSCVEITHTWKDYIWECAYCEIQYPSFFELKTHSMQSHECCNALRCIDCRARKLKLVPFIKHVKCHRQHLKLSCFICFEVFPDIITCNKHVANHFKSKFICVGCNSTFTDSQSLEQHSQAYNHDRKTRNIPLTLRQLDNKTCAQCNKTFSSKASLYTHLFIHTHRERNYVCDRCGKGFFTKRILEDHLIETHSEAKPYQCHLCKWKFKTKRRLITHSDTHKGLKPYACDKCGKCFRLVRQLSSHSIIHTDLLPYTCDICNKQFRFKNILNLHLRLHTGEKPYSCESCQKDFTNWSNYNKHMKRIHGTNMSKKIPNSTAELEVSVNNIKCEESKEEQIIIKSVKCNSHSHSKVKLKVK